MPLWACIIDQMCLGKVWDDATFSRPTDPLLLPALIYDVHTTMSARSHRPYVYPYTTSELGVERVPERCSTSLLSPYLVFVSVSIAFSQRPFAFDTTTALSRLIPRLGHFYPFTSRRTLLATYEYYYSYVASFYLSVGINTPRMLECKIIHWQPRPLSL